MSLNELVGEFLEIENFKKKAISDDGLLRRRVRLEELKDMIEKTLGTVIFRRDVPKAQD